MKVIYVMQNDDNTYEYEGVTKIDDRTDSRRIKGYKNDELLFDIDRGLLKNFHTIDQINDNSKVTKLKILDEHVT